MAALSRRMRFENWLFAQRKRVVGLFLLVTLLMLAAASQLRVDAGFAKQLPMQHEYMQTFQQYQQEFGGANRVLIAVVSRNGDMFTPGFFKQLAGVTDEVFFIPGVDRARVSSLFTPNVRFTEVVEDGISGGNVIPADFEPTAAGLAQVRQNILKSGVVGRLVANDFSAALVSVQLQEVNPQTGKALDYLEMARQLELVRAKYQNDEVSIHIIGFAKVVGEVAEGSQQVLLFFLLTVLLTLLLSVWYTRSFKMTLVLLGCALTAVVWQLGLLPLLGFGIDPMSILIPFLVFAIAVSHGVQMVSNHQLALMQGMSAEQSARLSYRRLLLTGCVALLSDTLGFLTIYLIEVRVIQEIALTASLGVAVIVVLNLLLLPLLLSFIGLSERGRQRLVLRQQSGQSGWLWVARVCQPVVAAWVVGLAVLLAGWGAWLARDVQIGDLHAGVPELRADSVYNQDSALISSRFSIGVDVLTVIAETQPEACVQQSVMREIDDFAWVMRQLDGVQSVMAMPMLVKTINAGWNEGNPKWQVLPRDESLMAQSVTHIPASSGLLNSNCSVMPVMIFTADHKASTIQRVVDAVKQYQLAHPSSVVKFKLATGNVGVMAATNEEIERAQFPILLYLFATIMALCWWLFRRVSVTVCIMLPLGLVSLLAYALMAELEIGLKVATLPMVALGAGVGVDYAIYLYSRLSEYLAQGRSLLDAYGQTLQEVGAGVVFTALTLALGVASWIFSPLKFQADMGLLLTFLFVVNMVAAVLLTPALARWLMFRPAKLFH